MKYTQNKNSSGEILRLVVQKMPPHPAAFTPLNYAVWYEFVTGINPALTKVMEKLLNSGGKLDDDTIEKLYVEYVSECSKYKQRISEEDLQRLLHKLALITAETNRQAGDFSNNLQTYGDTLKQPLDVSKLDVLIDSMVGDADKMRGSMLKLQSELEASEQEIEKLHQELESARNEALTDPLTGILNRRGFEVKAQQLLDDPTATDRGWCLLMLDIDHFKKINDTYGHLFGDKVIRSIAQAIKFQIKGQDAVARLGGEEFGVLLPGTNLAGASVVAEQIRSSVEKGRIRRIDTHEQIGGITISIGIAAYTPGSNITVMLDHADRALYASKKSGKNKSSVYGQ